MRVSSPVLNEAESNQVYLWVDSLPLSRPKKNIARDFSDAVLAAEIVSHLHPKLIDAHNYPASFNPKQKFTNWSTFNRKVLARVGLVLSDSEIDDLVNAKPKAIEFFLLKLKPALENYTYVPPALGRFQSVDKSRTQNYSTIAKHEPAPPLPVKKPLHSLKLSSNQSIDHHKENFNHNHFAHEAQVLPARPEYHEMK